MKKLLIATLFVFIGFCSTAQNAKVDGSGNYVALKTSATREPAKATGKTFTDAKGTQYPVMESAKGKLFYMRTSKKTGNEYKVYLKLEG